jgi:hypothetical protein
MHIAETLVRDLGRHAPQHVVDQIQAAIRCGGSDLELQKLAERLELVSQILEKKS